MESLTGKNVESSTFSPSAKGQVLNFLCQQEVAKTSGENTVDSGV